MMQNVVPLALEKKVQQDITYVRDVNKNQAINIKWKPFIVHYRWVGVKKRLAPILLETIPSMIVVKMVL